MTLAALVLSGVLRLLAEWQRRETFRVLMAGTPEGTVVTQHDSPDGHFMRASLGSPLVRRLPAG